MTKRHSMSVTLPTAPCGTITRLSSLHADISPEVSVTIVIGSLSLIFSISVQTLMSKSISDLSISISNPPLVWNT